MLPTLFSWALSRHALAPVLLLLAAPAFAAEAITTAVYSQVGNGYRRTKADNGKFKPEYYAIANGGVFPGTTRDHTIDRVTYPEVAGLIAQFLAKENYFLAKDKKSAQLLLVLHWGKTIPYNDANYSIAMSNASDSRSGMLALGGGPGTVPDAGAGPFGSTSGAAARAAEADFEMRMMMLLQENDARDRANEQNARLLGYLREVNDHNGVQRFSAGRHHFDDLRADIEESRYYIVVSAYDFREATEKNNLKLQWVTRVSVRSPGHAFDKQAAAMLAAASRYFGQESGRLIRQYTPEGRVEIGETEVIGVAPDGPAKGKK
ncbi:MAG TPA: hypothetical protein VEB66_10860 [Opitutaceae bacterium]|nr:hypothetical protein [Opitutaceae bacterium]